MISARPLRLLLHLPGAETLTKSNIQALPFISEYKWFAIVVVVALFVIEAILATVRALVPQSVLPVYISSIVAFIVEVTLVVCYLSAAVAIARRIGTRGKTLVRKMTVRIAVSSGGYVICLAALISFAVAYQQVWGRAMTLNSVFVGLNLAGLMQVLALRPVPRKSKASKDASSSHATSSVALKSKDAETPRSETVVEL